MTNETETDMDRTLVIMAAGLGSRYGGVKQMTGVGPDGEILMEYAVFDALSAGFNRVVAIIKPDMLKDVKERCGDRIEKKTGIRIDYAFQTSDRFTESRPEFAGRSKPLGTVHAVLCAKEFINTPFAVINADDYYGRSAFEVIAPQLDDLQAAEDAAMVAYRPKNTVSEFGTVTRGVCGSRDGYLSSVTETYKIKLFPDGTIRDTSESEEGPVLSPDSLVSMNLWGFSPKMLDVMERYFESFLEKLPEGDNKSECLLPTMVGDMIAEDRLNVKVLSSGDRWFGLTYKEDTPGVVAALSALHENGTYPPTLWG